MVCQEDISKHRIIDKKTAVIRIISVKVIGLFDYILNQAVTAVLITNFIISSNIVTTVFSLHLH